MSDVDSARIKRKMLGVRIRSARMQVGLELDEAARHLAIPAEQLNDYELGMKESDLPELEALAKICQIPVSYFWSNGAKSPDTEDNVDEAISIRRKMMGVILRQLREDAAQTPASTASAIRCTEAEINSYESGEQAIPLSRLEALATFFNVPLGHFLAEPQQLSLSSSSDTAQSTQLPATRPNVQATNVPADLAWLTEVPDDVKTFLADPASLLYLKLSVRLNDLSAATLRKLAEEILEITY